MRPDLGCCGGGVAGAGGAATGVEAGATKLAKAGTSSACSTKTHSN